MPEKKKIKKKICQPKQDKLLNKSIHLETDCAFSQQSFKIYLWLKEQQTDFSVQLVYESETRFNLLLSKTK